MKHANPSQSVCCNRVLMKQEEDNRGGEVDEEARGVERPIITTYD
jgi:hypothetical protein